MGLHLDVAGTRVDLLTGTAAASSFISGVTQPYYVETANLDGAKNVGNKAGVTLTPYAGTPYSASANGNSYRITDSAVYENILFTGQVMVYGATPTFRNCRFLLPKTFIRTDVTQTVVGVLNGSTTDAVFEDCEIHNRAQRPFNGIQGRNFRLYRTVITGTNDAFSESTGGTTPTINNRGFEAYDCIVPSLGFWYSNPANDDIHSDTGAHVDVYQKQTSLAVRIENSTLIGAASEFIGTGTPGSGRDAGNTYVTASGTDYTASQAQGEAWRTQHTYMSPAAQSMWGVSRRMWNEGSMSCCMLNGNNFTLKHCWLDGGSVGINMVNAGVTPSTTHLTDNTFWNGMGGGPGSRTTNPAIKGNAILAAGAHVFGTETGNRWADELGGALLVRVSESGYGVWR